MDSGADTTQKIVIGAAIFLGIIIVLTIGISLYSKAKTAEGELANKIALDTSTKRTTEIAGVSLTNEAKNKSGVNYDGLVQKRQDDGKASTTLEIVNETTPIEAPKEDIIPKEDNTEDPNHFNDTPVEPVAPTKPVPVDPDQPLSYEEILRIRQLPIENSPAGNLQTALEEESSGEYKARY